MTQPRYRPPHGRDEQIELKQWLAFGVGVVALGLVVWVIWLGWPASGWTIGLGLAFFLCEAIKKEIDPKADPNLTRGKRITKGAVAAASNYSLWATIGCALVWISQLLLALFASDVDPATIGTTQLFFADVVYAIRVHTAPSSILLAFAIVIAIAVAFERFWPINALAISRKWVGNTAAVLGAIGGFSFVGAGVASARYDRGSQVLRAQIVRNLDQLAQARREGAAFRWLNDLAIRAVAHENAISAAWQPFFEVPLDQCGREQAAFAAGYDRALRHWTEHHTAYCDSSALTDRLADSRIRRPAADGTPAPATAWLPDLAPIVTVAPAGDDMLSDPGARATLVPSLMRIGDLRQVATVVTSKLNDASAARDAVRKAATGSVGMLLQKMMPDAAGNLFKYWSGALLEDVTKAAIARIGRRVEFTRLADNRVVRALVNIDEHGSGVLAPSSSAGAAAAQGEEEYRSYLNDSGNKAGLSREELAEAGAKAYAADEAHDRAKAAAQEALFAEMAKVREVAERARMEHPEFHGR